VLRHEALHASSGGGDSNTNTDITGGENRLIGREELYRSVEDLCVHKFGIRLYYHVVSIMEEAAGEVVRRLASTTTDNDDEGNNLNAMMDSTCGNVGYNAATLIADLNLKDGGCAGSVNDISTASNGGSGEDQSFATKRLALLQRMHTVCRTSYANEYLTFVRSIFLALDRAFVYYAERELEEITENDHHGSTRQTSAAHSSSAMEVDGQQQEVVSGGDQQNRMPLQSMNSTTNSSPGGKVMERSSASSNNTRIWGLWEVGIACLRLHMVRRPATKQALPNSSDDGSSGKELGTLSVLTTMVVTTAYAILSEYDDDFSNHTSIASYSTMGDSRPLLRNCVRTIIDLGALPSLLEELIVVASARFEKEGVAWGMALSEGKKSAPEFLCHVETRLRQSLGLAGYYLPGNAESVGALRRLSKLKRLTGAIPSNTPPSSSSKVVSWCPANNSTRRIFPAIIENQLLGPHLLLPTCGILEPRHLHPMLDDNNDDAGSAAGGDTTWKIHSAGGGRNKKTYENAKRLYGLCWRMTCASSALLPPREETAVSQLPTSALNHLRLAFGEYGRLRGTEIVKQGLPPKTSSPNGGSGTTPLPSTTSNVNTKEMEKKIIPDLLAFKNHLYSLHAVAFRSEESFGGMVRSILDDVLNGSTSNSSSMSNDDNGDGGRRIAELLAKHVDMRFKDAKASASSSSSQQIMPATTGGSNMVSAAMIATVDANESFQNEILALFRHIHSKDVFEAFYKRDLAKRLLTGRAVSTDMERSFMTKLKAECGAGYTSKMEGMFKDMDLSRDIMGSYAAYSAGQAGSGATKTVDMDVQVLTTGYWPVYPKYANIILPPELLALRTKFETYYNDKYQGRRITWQYSLGNCIVKASFPKSVAPKELIVNVCQSLVLLCFGCEDGEDGKGLTLEEIMKKTGIEDKSELERVLQSLSMGRDGTRVLKKVDYDSPTKTPSPSKQVVNNKDGDGSPRKAKKQRVRRTVGPHDRFLFNASFTSNQRRIRITNITMKETTEERTKTHASVSKDRLYFIDAAVVRIMKARKAIDHRGLIGEVMAQLKFPATAADIKKRIESLIEREYMERVEGDRSKYKYLA